MPMVRKRKLVSRRGYIQERESQSVLAGLERLQQEVVALTQKVACLSADIELRQKLGVEPSEPWEPTSDQPDEKVGDFARKKQRKSAWGVNVEPGSYVYFVLCSNANAVKIGYSTVLKSRLSNLQVGNPERLKLLTWIPGGRNEETVIHDFFADYSINVGEWFNYVGDLKKYIAFLSQSEPGTVCVHPRDWKNADQPRKPSTRFIASTQSLRSLESADRYLAYALPPASTYGEPEEVIPEEIIPPLEPVKSAQPKAKPKVRSQSKPPKNALPPAKAETREPRILTQVDGVFK